MGSSAARRRRQESLHSHLSEGDKILSYQRRNSRAFTLIELLVAVGILVVVMSFAGSIFKLSINTNRLALANAEIMQKLRAITSQLDADFKGLDKDAEIFVVWEARPVTGAAYQDNDLDGYERFDRIFFFANGDFQSYSNNPLVRGNTAWICYMLAKNGTVGPGAQPEQKRMLARVQHILTADEKLADFFKPSGFTDSQWQQWLSRYEYDKISVEQWKVIPWADKMNILSVIADVKVDQSSISQNARGPQINPADANSIHLLLCEGVSELKIQGWYDAQKRWIPEVDPDGDGNLADSQFYLNEPNNVPGVLYPYTSKGGVVMNNITYPREQVDRVHFNAIPGLGRALKFTFTLFDSKGIIKNGRTFTHIVYLDD
jgi:prepilin-type N-terminal cleavage/methylation domain-containing protein